tara:strand:+ start:228 stop:470 length:243 start_codon:yes stop_codon:yes gene_type:complete
MKSDNTLLCPDVRRTYDTDWFLLSVRLNIKECCVATQLKECVFMGEQCESIGCCYIPMVPKGITETLSQKNPPHAPWKTY